MTERPSFMAELGARLVDNGYPVIPIMPGSKVPGQFRGGAWHPYPGWGRHGQRATTSAEIEIWSRWPRCGVGIATGAVVGIDIDVSEPALDALMERDDMLSPFWDAVIGRPDPVSAEGNG